MQRSRKHPHAIFLPRCYSKTSPLVQYFCVLKMFGTLTLISTLSCVALAQSSVCSNTKDWITMIWPLFLVDIIGCQWELDTESSDSSFSFNDLRDVPEQFKQWFYPPDLPYHTLFSHFRFFSGKRRDSNEGRCHLCIGQSLLKFSILSMSG